MVSTGHLFGALFYKGGGIPLLKPHLDPPPTTPYTEIIQKIVTWYKAHHELFPWRTPDHGWQQHYRVWVSEIMLQQTTVQSVIPYFERFMTRFPDCQTLAHASIDAVLTYWQGLGYYRRAHHLHKAAIMIAKDYAGVFPKEYSDIRSLPGVGDYTAAAISAIASHQPFVPVDGNVIRVFSRLLEHRDEPQKVLPLIREDAKRFQESFGDAGYNFSSNQENRVYETQLIPSFFAQGLMDLGRTICTPKNPNCPLCPLQTECIAYDKEVQNQLPIAAKKAITPVKYAKCWVLRRNHQIFLQKRVKKGLLSGLWHAPMTDFMENTQSFEEKHEKSIHIGVISHVFSHFKLFVDIELVDDNVSILNVQKEDGVWVDIGDLHHYALATLMKKILKKAGIL